MPLLDIRPLRQQGASGISVSILDQSRRNRDDDNTNNKEDEGKTEQPQQQQQQDLSKLIPEALNSSVKENGGDPSNIVLRFRFDNISSPISSSSSSTTFIKDKVLEILRIVFAVPANRAAKSFTLDLERCGVTDDVLGELFEYLEKDETQKGSVLTHLFLAGNLITAKGLQKLLHVPDKNPPITTETGKHLIHLGVTANPLGGRGLDVLSEYLEINPITNKLKILHATRVAWASNNNNNQNKDESCSSPVAKPPGVLFLQDVERFANAVKNAANLATVYFKQNTIHKCEDDEIPWPKSVIMDDK